MSHNPAAAIQTQHVELERLADRLRIIAAAPLDVIPERRYRWLLESELRRLETQLLSHLDWEERDGYMRGAGDTSTRFGSEVETLRSQHVELRAGIRRLVDESYDDADLALIRADITAFLDQVHVHEVAETRLLESLIERDAGPSSR